MDESKHSMIECYCFVHQLRNVLSCVFFEIIWLISANNVGTLPHFNGTDVLYELQILNLMSIGSGTTYRAVVFNRSIQINTQFCMNIHFVFFFCLSQLNYNNNKLLTPIYLCFRL